MSAICLRFVALRQIKFILIDLNIYMVEIVLIHQSFMCETCQVNVIIIKRINMHFLALRVLSTLMKSNRITFKIYFKQWRSRNENLEGIFVQVLWF